MRRSLREWADLYRDRGKYTPVGVAFHWIMAGVVLYQLFSGWTMERELAGADKLASYRVHSEIGLTLLVLGGLRLVWRLMVPGPINDADEPGWRSTLAKGFHALFYALFVIIPVSGWALWSAIQPAQDLQIAGLIPLPAMPFHDLSPEWQRQVLRWSMTVHVSAIVILSLVIPLHAAAALKHHFIDHDDVLEGMLPDVPDDRSHPSGKWHRPQAVATPLREVRD